MSWAAGKSPGVSSRVGRSGVDAAAAAASKLRSHSAELDAIFRCIDRDRDGRVSLADLSFFINDMLHQNKSEGEILGLLMEVAGVGAPGVIKDAKGAPILSYPSFLAFIERQLTSPLSEILSPIFNFLDRDKDGKVTAADLNAFSSEVGLRLGEDGASQLLQSAGAPSDAVDYEHFCSIVSRCLPS